MKSLNLYARRRVDEAETLVTHHAELVKRIANHLRARLPGSVQMEDLIQAGMLGLLEAARRYDPAQGASFTTFAERRIRGAMLDEIRKGDWAPRSVHRKGRDIAEAIRKVETVTGGEASDRDVAECLGMSVTEYHDCLADLQGQKLLSIEEIGLDGGEGTACGACPDRGPAETAQREDLLRRLVAAIDGLPERERLVLSLYYDEELNLKEIGAVLGVSESRVSQLHSQSLLRLRARVNG